jgi:hypothetical protein
MKPYIVNEFKKQKFWCRSIELIPSITINLYKDYKLESIRFSWLGFTIGFH